MVVEPDLSSRARPFGVIAATEGVEEVQVARLVTSVEEPSDIVATALNCWVLPVGITAEVGVMLRDKTVGGVLGPPELWFPPPQAYRRTVAVLAQKRNIFMFR
jgi:hypothetical protein